MARRAASGDPRRASSSGEFDGDDADETMFVLAALLDGLAPLLAVRGQGRHRERVERTWLGEAARLLGPGFDASPLARPRRFRGRVVG